MPKVMVLNKGRKRKLRAIQWTALERVSAAALFLLLVGFSIGVAIWVVSIYSTDPQEPHLQDRR